MKRLVAILFTVMLICAGILGILFIIPENTSADVSVSGSISTDTTWTLANSPYFVEGNITVESGVVLTIEAGVEVRFNGSFSFIVNGTLNATGTSGLPIKFTSNQTLPSSGDWQGIILQGTNNTMDYWQISNCEDPLYITGSNTNNSISNSRIFNSTGNGISLENTTYNTLSNISVSNSNGYGIYFNSSDNNVVQSSNISYNEMDAVHLSNSDQNTFSSNSMFSNNGSAINLTSSSSSNTIKINTLISNNKTGIHITGSSNSNTISRNSIVSNSLAGINITGSIDNLIHHNNFDSNGQNGYDSTSQLNSWDTGVEGNWWSDYGGSDSDGDGIGETPHNISGGGSKDFYPLVNPVNINAPIIESTVPSNAAENVSVTPSISVTFSTEMNRSSAENATSMSGGATPTSFVWSNGNKTLTFDPSITLSSETIYTINISTDAKDLADIQMDLNYSFYFTTEDSLSPEISSTTPANGTVDVLITADIVVVFSEEMNTTSVTYTCFPDPGGWSVVWSAGNTTATYSHNDFASETTYTFNITGGKDAAGNDLVAGSVPNPWTFTTEDVVAPEISSTTPANGTVDVLITADIVVVFSEEMNTTSVTYTCSPDPGGWSVVWSAGNTTATYSHNDLASESTYTFNITGAKDTAGNDLVAGSVPNPWTFTTEDVVEPEISTTTPANGTVDVLITADIVAVFSEEMNTTSVTYTCSPDPGGWSVVWSAGNTTATYSHNDFDSLTSYTFNITGAKDTAGNDLVAGSVPNPWTFTTVDANAPDISSTTPVNGTIDVLITADIVVVFSEEMNTTSVTYTCSPDPGGWSVVWSVGNTTATYSHNDFTSETTYTFNITGAKDTAGNDLVAGAVPNPWTFTTEDVIGPEISTTSPSNGESDVLITSNVVVTFNEEMNTSSVTYSCTPDPGGWSVVWSAGNTTATHSHNDFDSSTAYIFEITAGKDVAGNDLAAGAAPNPWTFTTEDADPPEITATSPVNGAIDIALNTDIIVTFSEEMNTTSVIYTITPDPGGWSVVWSAGNTTATYSHSDFGSATTYIFEITGAKDLAGNDIVAGAVPNPFSFTTVDVVGPEISSTSPSNGESPVLVSANIIVTFNEEMNTSTVTYTCNPDPGGWSVVWSGGNTIATYSHNDFDSETSYIFAITGGKDIAGNDLAAGSVPNPFSFTTGDAIAPEISSTTPVNGTIDVLITADIVVVFSEEMNTSSVTYTCNPDPGGWSVVWSAGNTTATYTHSDFASETTYTFEITVAKDLAGNDLVSGAVPNPFSFTTEDVIAPQISSSSPVNGTIDVLITADIVIIFSEEMNTSTVTYTCNPDPGGWSVVWSARNSTATYSHNDFSSETTYTFEITGGEDLTGIGLAAGSVPNPFSFTTEDVIAPEISSTSPVNGTIDVLIGADIIVTFNEEMNTTSVTYTCTPDPGGWSIGWTAGNTIATYSHNDFDSETTYTFEITAAWDPAGNNLVAGAVPNPFTFTTEDVITPEITITSPVNGTIDVPLNVNIVVTFSEEMNTSSVTYSCTPDPGGWTVVWSMGDTVATYSHNDLLSTTTYTFEITGAKDPAGNDLVAGSVPNPFSFTTEDVVGPQISSTTPANGAMNVVITADLVVNFNEVINTSSVTYTCTPDPGGWSVVWSAGDTTVTYSHIDFTSETTYTFEITGAKDVAGNNLVAGAAPNPWTFTTQDVNDPEISSTSPTNGTIDVLVTAELVVTFSEDMNISSVTYTCTPDPGGWTVVWSGGNTTVTYSHNAFDSETTFTFEITGASDLAGNNLIAGSVPNPFSFTTVDALKPIILFTSPVNGNMNVDQTANIVVTFSEAMDTSSISYGSSPNPGGWFITWSVGDTVATFSHSPFDSYNTYTFQILDVMDLAGNNLGSGAAPNPWSFTTIDSISPSISATSPLDGAVDIGLTQNVIVTFSEAMNISSLTYSCFPDPGGWTVVWSSGDTVVTFSHGAFSDSTMHTFQIANVLDAAGNNLAPGSIANPWTFTTIDATSPEIIAASPPDASMDIAINADIVVTFNEEMNKATVAFLCVPDPGGWSSSWNAQSTEVTYSHSVFDEQTSHSFQIVSGEDIAGNSLAAGALPNPWTFTTEDITQPTISATTPSDGTPSIVLDQDVTVTFSEPINNASLTYTVTPDPGGWTVVWSTGDTMATFSHSPFSSDTAYTFQITAFQDLAGNDMAAGSVPNPWSFSTIESIAPTITLTSPSDGTVDVDLQLNVTVTFSEAMNTASVSFTCSPDPGGWSITWSAGDSVATFSHDKFDKSMVFTFQIVSGWDPAGNNLIAGSAPNPFSFTTVANVPPTILSIPITTATEDVQYLYDVEVQDGDDDTLTHTLTSYPTGMTINPTTGLISWTPTNNQVGPNNITVLVTDGDGAVDSQSFTITVANVNDDPTITSTEIVSTIEDMLYSYDVDALDVDLGDTITYSLTTSPAGMSIDPNTGLILWTPTNSQVGDNAVIVWVTDGNGGSDTQSFTITVTNSNDAPIIISTPVTTATEDVLYVYDVDANDVDVGDTLTFSLTAFPTGMTIDPGTGVISWTPTNSQVGPNPVTVLVSDGMGGSNSQPFTITVANANDPPSITSTAILTATEEMQYTYDVEALDIDGDILAYVLSTYPSGMAIDNASGLISWTPTNSQVGDNNVVVLVLDGNGGTDTQSFTITVSNTNDAPTITSSPVTTATEDQVYVYDVDAADVDLGDSLTFGLSAFPTGMTIDSITGAISWTPTNSQVGSNPVTVLVSDGNSGSDTQSFTIDVWNANDAPTITSTSITSATEDVLYTYDVEALDIDVGDTLSYSLTTSPNGMTIDIATGLIDWTPTNDDVGSHNVVVLVSDSNGGTDTQSFSINVVNTNDAPTITSTPITSATDDILYTYDVEADDVDSGDTLTFSLTMFPTGMTINPTTGLIQWTPNDGHVGVNSVNVVVEDGSSETDSQFFTINVANANDEPIISSTPIITGVEDSPYSYGVEVQDPDFDTFTFSLTTKPTGMTIDSVTGLILWTPTNDHVGSNNVVVLVDDNQGGSDTQSYTIDVTNTNDGPTITSTEITFATEDLQYSYDVEADDVDFGDSLTFSLMVSPGGMTINPTTGLITWLPTNDHVGVNNVEVVVSDENGGSDTQFFTITVSNTNDAPTIITTPILAGTEDIVYNYNVNATDVDIGDTLTYSLTTYPISMVIDGATGMITWTPTNSDVGSNSVNVRVVDVNGGQDMQSFTITVSNVNDPPIITSPEVKSATQDSQYTYNVIANDIDSADTLTYSLTVFPEGMTINSTTGEITWIPAGYQVGDNSISIEVFDAMGEQDTQSFTITVANINDAPTFTSQPVTEALEGTLYFYEVVAFDVDGDTLIFSLVSSPEGMVFDPVEGSITWTPSNSQVGPNLVTIKLIDGNGAEVEQSFTVNVENVNSDPNITSTPGLTAKEEVVYTYTILADDEDPNDQLSFELVVYPANMNINSTAGIISWRPANSQVGDNSVVIVVSDGNGGSATQSFSIDVSNVNDVPIFTSEAITDATEDEQYTYDVNAVDVDFGDTLVYSLNTAPSGMTIDSETGIINWVPEDAQVGDNNVVVEVTDNNSESVTQSFIITVKNVNDAPEMSDEKVVPETGTNRQTYVFSLIYMDPDGDSGDAKLYINGIVYDMRKISGNAVSGEVYTYEIGLGARNHTYYFEIDDDEGHIVVSDVFTISVSHAEVEPEEEDLLPIPLWWLVLILIVIVLIVAGLLARSRRQLKRQRRASQQFSQQIAQRPAQAAQRVQPKQAAKQTWQPSEKEEKEKSLLDFGK